jgi:maltose O-acetyltransferase
MRRIAGLTLYYVLASHLPDLAFPGGGTFNSMRCATLRMVLPRFGARNEIDSRVYIGDGSDVSIGSRCQINRGCRLNRVSIGDNVMLGPDVFVVGQLHRTDDLGVPMVDQGEYTKEPTAIEDDVWVGARAVIMPGTRVGMGSIVGAGAVVTRDVDPYTVVGGVPAKLIRKRESGGDGQAAPEV